MKNLFDPSTVATTKLRILQLHSDSVPQWGSMGATQALAHCTAGIEMAMGAIRPKPSPFPARILGKLIKPLVFGNDKPMRRNSPSAPELFPAHAMKLDFARERSRLVEGIESFATHGPAGCSSYPHPFFGKLKPMEWAILMYKHMDHHLRQFGV